MNKKILITGGAGYIGSHTLLEFLKNTNYEIVVFDNFENGNIEALHKIKEYTKKEFDVIKGDLRDIAEIDAVFTKFSIDSVIHFAAYIEAGLSAINPTRFFENNIIGTLNLIKSMQKSNVKKIVFSSTAAVYGTPKQEFVDEESEIKYENNYGASKYLVEEILRGLSGNLVDLKEKINSVILRYFNACGADESGIIGQNYPKPTHALTLAINTALGKNNEFTIFGNDYPTKDGTCVRDYIHVSDLASAHIRAFEYLKDLDGSEVFCIGTGTGTSVLELVHEVEKIHGKFNWKFGNRRPGDPAGYIANPAKAKRLLSWQPRYSFGDAVLHAYNWAKNNPNGYKGN